jgi:hypothetical protein
VALGVEGARTPAGLPDIYGIGPVITATIIGEVGNAARFRHEAGKGGQAGTTLQIQRGRPNPVGRLSGKPQPGPTTETTPTPIATPVDRGVPICARD